MLLLIYLPEIVALIGLLMFALCAEPYTKTRRVGEIMFFCGLLATLLTGIRHP